jgi:hypothetical protein
MQTITPLDWRTPLVTPDLTPSPQFIRLWQQMFGNGKEAQDDLAAVEAEVALKADKTTRVDAVTGETTGGGDLSANRSIGLADTAVTPGTYGDSTHVPSITVDQKGRVTAASQSAFSSGSVYMPVVDGSIPPVFIQLPDGNLVYVKVA